MDGIIAFLFCSINRMERGSTRVWCQLLRIIRIWWMVVSESARNEQGRILLWKSSRKAVTPHWDENEISVSQRPALTCVRNLLAFSKAQLFRWLSFDFLLLRVSLYSQIVLFLDLWKVIIKQMTWLCAHSPNKTFLCLYFHPRVPATLEECISYGERIQNYYFHPLECIVFKIETSQGKQGLVPVPFHFPLKMGLRLSSFSPFCKILYLWLVQHCWLKQKRVGECIAMNKSNLGNIRKRKLLFGRNSWQHSVESGWNGLGSKSWWGEWGKAGQRVDNTPSESPLEQGDRLSHEKSKKSEILKIFNSAGRQWGAR
jgi:hypothetical protein